MTRTRNAPEPGSAQWLLDKSAAEPSVLREAGKVIADGGHSNDACLKARRLVEAAWGLRLPDPQYRQAADRLDKTGQGRLAGILFSIAGTSAELAAARQAWQARMTAAPAGGGELVAAQFADGLIEVTGVPVPGVDGAWYQTAVRRGSPLGQARPAVLVSTMATRELVTGFGSEPAMTAWLRTRERAAGRGPLTEPGVGPPPRLVLEERVLAWLIRHPDWLPDAGDGIRAGLWTAECRHEIDAALRTAGARDGREGYPRAVRELRRRTLRAPEWAGELIGWPDGKWVQQYLGRLACTDVSETTARGAFQALIAVPSAPGPAAALAQESGPVRLWPAPGRPARPATAHDQFAAGLYTPHHPRPDSFGARTRVTRPGPQP
jgi:hypothetical protein